MHVDRWCPRVRSLIAWCGAAAGAALACAPATDLTNVSPGGGGAAGGPAGPAGAQLVDPAAGAIDVPLNLAAVVVRFPQPVTWGTASLRVCDGDAGSAPVPTAAPSEMPCDQGVCYRAGLSGALPPGVSCHVTLGDGVADASGNPVATGTIGIFENAEAADTTPPALGDLAVAAAGPCLAVSFSTDEPATGTVSIQAGGVELDSAAGVGQTRFDVALPLGSLPAAAPAALTVTVADRAGNIAASAPFSFTTPDALPPVAITEVLPNAAGPEPAQEWVELRNLGGEPVALAGLRIEDSKGSDELPPEILPAGAYGLIVSSAYDPAQGQDVAPRTGTLLLRVDTRVGADGLSNSGEPVRLMMGDALVSSYGGWIDVSSSKWAGKGVHRLIQDACDRADVWNHAPLEATPGAGPP